MVFFQFLEVLHIDAEVQSALEGTNTRMHTRAHTHIHTRLLHVHSLLIHTYDL